jgi:hypothetical protein
VGVRSLIRCGSSTRHLVKVSQVFCGACTEQGAPSRKHPRVVRVRMRQHDRPRTQPLISRANQGRNRSSHPRHDMRPSARYAYDAVAFASQSHRACPAMLVSSGKQTVLRPPSRLQFTRRHAPGVTCPIPLPA